MRKIADLFLNENKENNSYKVVAYENMKKEDLSLVEDLMRRANVKCQIDNSCKDIKKLSRGNKDISVADFKINVNALLSANIQVKIFLLPANDVNDLKISIYSLVSAPGA